MPPILNAQSLSKRYGARVLFEGVSFAVSEGDRIGLIGPNGAGKSTLLAILAGREEPDAGEVAVRKRARVAYVMQNSEFAPGLTVRDVVVRALAEAAVPEGEREQRLRETLGRAGFESDAAEAASLSGGWRKRLAIAEAVVTAPDVLLLDEPTNHLDLAGIAWLEELLASLPCASVTVSHDRYFLEEAANEVVELNRAYPGGSLRVKGPYSQFLEEREEFLEAQSRAQESLRNTVRSEIEWLRRAAKARTTKSKARIDKANAMIAQLEDVQARTQKGTAGVDLAATDRQTKRLVELKEVTCGIGDHTVARDLSLAITAGTRVGLVGPNGAGKTTLLRLLTGELEPTAGEVKRAPLLKTVLFSQNREIDLSRTLRRALAPEGDAVVHNGREVHVASWAARFLFTGDQLNQPVERLSGGERARVLIARLMLQPADLLLLDEPTNDLDIPTLEVLEQNLLEYSGAMVLVTHDRFMLDRVSTTVLGLDGRGNAALFADYGQWETWVANGAPAAEVRANEATKPVAPAAPAAPAKKKLSYLEQREWDAMDARIAEAEARVQTARSALADPAIATDAARLQAAMREQETAEAEAEMVYTRWAELAEKAGE